MELSNQNLDSKIEQFHRSKNKPSFSISEDTDVHILFFKRKDKYYGIRSADKSIYSSRAEFLVDSFLIEEVRANVKQALALRDLSAEECTLDELSDIFSRAHRIEKHLPNIESVESSETIVNDSDLNWIFIEDQSKYHSLFWAESESKHFSRRA